MENDLRGSLQEAKAIESLIRESEIVIFGAGNTSVLYAECFENEKINIKFFCDNNKNKQGKIFMGKEVISPCDVKERCINPIVFILSMNPEMCLEIKMQCDQLGLKSEMFDKLIFSRHEEEIMDNYSMLDDVSKKVYEDIILARINGTVMNYENISKDGQYFCIAPFMRNRPKEVFVDCGAFVGDTVEKYIWNKTAVFDKIYAFEPNKKNYSAMCTRIKRLNEEWGLPEEKIIPVFAGIGKANGKVFVENESEAESSTTTRLSSNGKGEVNIYSLDNFFEDKNVGFIKADIEGFEKDMIKGAEQLIKRSHPVIAVCIYHNANDMYSIMQIIKKYDAGYRFAIRHHSYEYCETVLYAW
ncbi:MAG: FkbM family methyltransferase [Bacteroides sp.]